MKSIIALSFAAALALVPLTASADTTAAQAHADAANKAANEAGKAATDMANKATECNTNCMKEKDIKACTDKCTTEMNAANAKVMGHANAGAAHAHAAGEAAGH